MAYHEPCAGSRQSAAEAAESDEDEDTDAKEEEVKEVKEVKKDKKKKVVEAPAAEEEDDDDDEEENLPLSKAVGKNWHGIQTFSTPGETLLLLFLLGHCGKIFDGSPRQCGCQMYYRMMPLWTDIWLFSVIVRLRPIPEFTDTTDTDTLDLHQYRYRVPIPIPVVTSQPPRRLVLRYYA